MLDVYITLFLMEGCILYMSVPTLFNMVREIISSPGLNSSPVDMQLLTYNARSLLTE
jgi:hypothetical protein